MWMYNTNKKTKLREKFFISIIYCDYILQNVNEGMNITNSRVILEYKNISWKTIIKYFQIWEFILDLLCLYRFSDAIKFAFTNNQTGHYYGHLLNSGDSAILLDWRIRLIKPLSNDVWSWGENAVSKGRLIENIFLSEYPDVLFSTFEIIDCSAHRLPQNVRS